MPSAEQTSARIAEAIKSALADCLPPTVGYDVQVTLIEHCQPKGSEASSDRRIPAAPGVIQISFAGPVSTGDAPSNVAESLRQDPGGTSAHPPAAAPRFRPVKLRGEPLSETVLRDRR